MWITPFFDNISAQFCYNASHAKLIGAELYHDPIVELLLYLYGVPHKSGQT